MEKGRAIGVSISTGRRIKNSKLMLARKMRREMTYAERCFWNAVRNRKLFGLKFRRQQIIEGFIADFYCHELRLIVEIDGGIHETQKDYDTLRTGIIANNDIAVMRFANDEVIHRFEIIVKRIEALLHPSPDSSGEGQG